MRASAVSSSALSPDSELRATSQQLPARGHQLPNSRPTPTNRYCYPSILANTLLRTPSIPRSSYRVKLGKTFFERWKPRKLGVRLALVPVGDGEEVVGAMVGVAV